MSTLLRMNSLFSILSKRSIVAVAAIGLSTAAASADGRINVLVWDEQQPVSKKVYTNLI